MKAKNLAQEFCQRDWLYALTIGKYQLEPAKIALSISLLSCAALSLELLLARVPFSQSVFLVSFQAFIIFPLAVILYYAVPNFLAKPFEVLGKAEAIGESRDQVETYAEYSRRMISGINSFIWIILALILIGYYWYYRLFTTVPSDPSRLLPDEIRPWIRIMLLIIYSPLFYMGVLTLGRIFVGLFFIGRFFQTFRIQVNPLSPDNAGGIGFLGQMLVTSALIATAIGIGGAGLVYVNLAAGNNPLERFEVISLGLLYLTITPLVFYSFMWAPHRALLAAREHALKPLADEYQRVSVQTGLSENRNVEAIKTKTEHLVEIKRQYDFIQASYPIWPLDTSSLRSLLATSILPAVSTLFSGFITDLWKIASTFINIGKP